MEEELVDTIKEMIAGDRLAGRALEDSCTDGFDTHYALLAQRIVAAVRKHDAKNAVKKK